MNVYNKIKQMTNDFNSTYRFGERPYQLIEAGDKEQHWGAVEKYFHGRDALASENSLSSTVQCVQTQTDLTVSLLAFLLFRCIHLGPFKAPSRTIQRPCLQCCQELPWQRRISFSVCELCDVQPWWSSRPEEIANDTFWRCTTDFEQVWCSYLVGKHSEDRATSSGVCGEYELFFFEICSLTMFWKSSFYYVAISNREQGVGEFSWF